MKKRKLLICIASVTASVLGLSISLSRLAFEREGDINRTLNINAEVVETTDENNYYNQDFKTQEELDAFKERHNIQMEEEGSVLLKNENSCLPLKTNERKVTLFGNTSVHNIFSGSSSGYINEGVSLYDSLIEEGFDVNNKVYNKIKAKNLYPVDGNINEVSKDVYSLDDISGYSDAAIVVIGRLSGETNDYNVSDSEEISELAFHKNEKDMMDFVSKAGFKKIIVLLNTSSPIELTWLDEYNVDACLYTGYFGYYGSEAIVNMLVGKATPSGHLVDTYAASSLSSPAMANYGDFRFKDLGNNIYHSEYMVYAEGIYTGYKYYETRYFDQVLSKHNATSKKGAFINTESWDYKKEVTYPFGYGLSYASFSKELKSFSWNKENHKVSASIEVKNISTDFDIPSKTNIELYVSLPYIEDGVEKSAIQLIGYTKTDALNKGESKEYTIEVSDYVFASYDSEAVNGSDNTKKGCYIFDEGDYYFSVGEDAHQAINNVLAKKGYSDNIDSSNFNLTNVAIEHLDNYDNITYSKNPTTGVIVSNKFEDVDINNFLKKEDQITYLSRSDWNTFPDSITSLDTRDDETGYLNKYMTARESLYEKDEDSTKTIEDYNWNASNNIKFYQMRDVPLSDNETWNNFIDQLSVSELVNIFGDKRGNDAIESISFPSTAIDNGPNGLINQKVHADSTIACSTFNDELIKEKGYILAQESFFDGLSCVFGGGANLHRTPFGGRNFEYFSEDATLTYYMAGIEAKAIQSNGLISIFKHFVGNDQEINRQGIATFMSEQCLRENELRGFEEALNNTNSLGVMTSYNRLGVISSASNKALLTDLLKGEWNYQGFIFTNSSKQADSYLFTADCLMAGSDIFLNDPYRVNEISDLIRNEKDADIYEHLRDAAKRYFSAFTKCRIINGLNKKTIIKNANPWWKSVIIAIDLIESVVFAVSLVLLFVFTFYIKEENENAKN